MLNTLLQTLLKSKGFPLSSGLPPFQTKKDFGPSRAHSQSHSKVKGQRLSQRKKAESKKRHCVCSPLIKYRGILSKWKQLETNRPVGKKECQTRQILITKNKKKRTTRR
uniref:Uncharacterized protein n=1 Tax=Anguilla anguilla TaxID=7936 RepID=A0A0E9V5N7_ANGAN